MTFNLRRGSRTLRFRLTALIVLLVGAAAAAVGAGSAIAVHSFLTARLDAELSLAGSRYALALEHPGLGADPGSDGGNDPDRGGSGGTAETTTLGQSVGTLGARLLNGQVTAIGVVHDADDPIVVSGTDRAVIAGLQPGGGRTVHLPDLGPYRMLVTPGRDGDTLVTGLPERVVAQTTGQVLLVEAAVFALVVLAAGAGGAFAVRRSLRPLDRVTSTALAVSEMPLATGEVRFPERVATADPHSEAGQVAAAVNHMLEQVEAALTARAASEDRLRQFLADGSHELRTPLAVTRSHTELLTGHADEWPASARESLRAIASGNARMNRLVQDLLLLAKMDAGVPLRPEPVDLSRMAVETVNERRLNSPGHHYQLHLPEQPVIVDGDEHHLHQVLTNLLANTAAHTPPGTSVLLTLNVLPAGPNTAPAVRLQIADDGPGFPPNLLPTIFGRFVRGDTLRHTSTGSTGLGLAIVAALVAAHHGTLTAANTPRGGAQVTVTLPAGNLDQHDPADTAENRHR